MSDIRTKILLGTSISAIAIMFVMASGVGIFANDTSVSETSFLVNGHVTVLAIHPDGSTSYSQSDNLILGSGKTLASDQLFGLAATGPFRCIGLGSSNAVDESLAGLSTEMIVSQVVCDGDGVDQTQAGVTNGDSEIVDVVVGFTIAAVDAGSITEVTLSSGGGGSTTPVNVISHVDITDVPVADQTQLIITYSLTVG